MVSQNPGTSRVLYKRDPSDDGDGPITSRGVVSENTIPSSVCTVNCDCAEIAVGDINVIVGSISVMWRGCWEALATLKPRSDHERSSARASFERVQDRSDVIGGTTGVVATSMYTIVLGASSTRRSTPRYKRDCNVVCASVGVGGVLAEDSLEDS